MFFLLLLKLVSVLARNYFPFRDQLKLFHSELLAQLEQKLELDIKYLTVSPHRQNDLKPKQFKNNPLTHSFIEEKQGSVKSSLFFFCSQATLKKYQSERRSKSESIERCQSQLKKLRRKSQGSRHPNKYGDREMQASEVACRWRVTQRRAPPKCTHSPGSGHVWLGVCVRKQAVCNTIKNQAASADFAKKTSTLGP